MGAGYQNVRKSASFAGVSYQNPCSGGLRGESCLQCIAKGVGRTARSGGASRREHLADAELPTLLDPPLTLGDGPEPPREAELAEGDEALAGGNASRRRRDRESDPEVGA